MKARIALLVNAILAVHAVLFMTSASSYLYFRPEIPEELRK